MKKITLLIVIMSLSINLIGQITGDDKIGSISNASYFRVEQSINFLTSKFNGESLEINIYSKDIEKTSTINHYIDTSEYDYLAVMYPYYKVYNDDVAFQIVLRDKEADDENKWYIRIVNTNNEVLYENPSSSYGFPVFGKRLLVTYNNELHVYKLPGSTFQMPEVNCQTECTCNCQQDCNCEEECDSEVCDCEEEGTTKTTDYKSEELSVYPNPADEYIYYPSGYDGVKIYNMKGEIQNISKNRDIIDISNLKQGLYILKTETESLKFMVK